MALAKLPGVFELVLHNCMLGGQRRKGTKLLTDVEALKVLGSEICSETNGVCDRTQEPHRE